MARIEELENELKGVKTDNMIKDSQIDYQQEKIKELEGQVKKHRETIKDQLSVVDYLQVENSTIKA